MSQKRIIDKRIREKYMKDDAYLNGQARLCGWQATLVYDSLCRHANIGQEAFPSIKLISEELAISRPTILIGLSNLEKFRVIEIKKQRNKKGKWLNNTYVLLDKSEWIKEGQIFENKRGKNRQRNEKGLYTQVNDMDTDNASIHVHKNTNPCPQEYKTQVNDMDTKETHSKGNTYKELATFNKLTDRPTSLRDAIAETRTRLQQQGVIL